MTASGFEPIAVVGRACLLPGADSPEALWEQVAAGNDLVSNVPADRWGISPDDVLCNGPEDSTDRTWSDRGGYVRGFDDRFDPSGFGLSADEIRALDPVFQWTFHTAREALRDAGHDSTARGTNTPRIGAVFGNLSFPSASMAAFTQATTIEGLDGYGAEALTAAGIETPHPRNRFTSGLPALLLERALGLAGGAMALDAACASSLYAIKLACDRLHSGEADLMLAGAVNSADDLCIHLGFSALTALSRTGQSRPFNAGADGLVPAEGCGFVALRRLDDALADGDTIHGVLRGVGLSNDGRGRGMLVPSSNGQTRAMASALAMSGLDASDISLIECHATGTTVGDATEVESTAAVYGDRAADDRLPIGSLKSNMGHLITAAGVAGLIKVLEAMKHETRPPTLHVDDPLAAIDASPFRLLAEAEPWHRPASGALRAGVSAFGFGGNNAHLIVEEPPTTERPFVPSETDAAPPTSSSIAIVGIGVAAAGAPDRAAFVQALLDNEPQLDENGEGRLDSIDLAIKRQKFPPNDLKKSLGQQLAMLQVTDEALADVSTLPGPTTGVYVGMGTDPEAARFGTRWRLATMGSAWGQDSEWLADARDAVGPALDAAGVLGTMPNIVANRLNSQYDLAGPSFTVSAEERSGIDAMRIAATALAKGEIDAALVGASDLSCDPVHQAAARRVLSDDRQIPGDGAAVVVLKRLDDAVRDGDTVYAVIPADDHASSGQATVRLGLDAEATALTPLFGHAHAASGLLHVVAGALLLHHRRQVGGAPMLASHDANGSGLDEGLGPRTVDVAIDPMQAASSGVVRLAEFASAHSPAATSGAPALHVFSGATAVQVLANVDARRESDTGPARLVIVAVDEEQLAERIEKARAHIEQGRPAGAGVHFRLTPLEGEVAAVFTAAGAAYSNMGVDLLAAMPELATPASQRFPLGEVADWAYGDAGHEPTPNDYLWGTALLSQAHATLTRKVLGINMTAAIGYSSGESNSLYAFDVWHDMDAMRNEIDASGMMDRELGVEFAAVARAWGDDAVNWSVWNVLAPLVEVQELVAREARVHVAIINTATDCVISGDSEACERIVDLVGRRRCVRVGYELACHVPEVAAAFHQPWVDIHTREVTPAAGVRHYSNGCASAYEVSSTRCAEVITDQAENTIDFPATIRAAYADGVRIFVEHGPAGACTNFIRDILADHDIVAVQLDRRGAGIGQAFEAIAGLVVAGVEVDHDALTRRLTPAITPNSSDVGPILSFAPHPPPVTLPARRTREPLPVHQTMAPAPVLPPIGAQPGAPAVAVPVVSEPARPEPELAHTNGHATSTNDVAAVIHRQMSAMTQIHHQFLADQAAVQQRFLASTSGSLNALPAVALDLTAPDAPVLDIAVGDTAVSHTAVADLAPAPAPATAPLSLEPTVVEPAVVGAAVVEPATARRLPVGPTWNKAQLEIHSSGKISELFGPMFEAQDEFDLQCRMPEPPLLLADRVTGLQATAGELGQGTIWTETDVEAGAWYLNEGYMPAGFMIESGQADLMLISYMGIDLLNLGTRSYRLLGCTLTYHGDLPSPGETLEYEIRITGHAKHGDIRLFFFEYDCVVDGEPRLTVRDAQAGFFTTEELEDALGVLWTPEDSISELSPTDRVDPPAIEGTKQSFTQAEVVAFSEGRALECFGPGFEWTETHTRTPKIQSGGQLFIDSVTEFDPTGGPWGRGFMRCETKVNDDDWFFDGHFKNDPCMPGNFMVEACIEAMSFYLAALGHTAKRDGWRFQPLPEQPFELKCRGEINPQAEHVAYELHVVEVWDGPHPTIICDVLGFVDGRPGFHAHRIGVELAPSWPLTSRPEIYEGVREPIPVATDSEGFPFDWKAMISCAWGRPSEAFGSMYEMFDGTRRSPRLPGEPYHFISRITKIDGDLDVCEAGMEIECEYDIPADAWYFDENGVETMPYAVLLEAALQPCGWVASAVGSATGVDEDLLFRNLDGTATLHGELTRTSGTLTTKVKLKSVSRAGGMIIEGFDVECFLGSTKVYSMTTVFGFFPPEAFEDQVGLPILETNQARLDAPTTEVVDLTTRPARYCDGPAHLAEPMLLMLDRAGHSRGAGEAGLGVVRGEKDVDVSEWFFKAHFFQDPVQPGSLGIEALLQLLQFYMLDTGMDTEAMANGLVEPHFEPIQIDHAMSWKYRGQVTPKNVLITSTMEITEVGNDDAGPYVIGTGSLWCDGLRIYEVENMGMRLVGGTPTGPSSTAAVEVPLGEVKQKLSSYWQRVRQTPNDWLIEDLFDGLTDRYVNSVKVPTASSLGALEGRAAIYVGNHQVQIESLVISNLLPALTGVPMTTVAHMKHRHRWIGQAIAAVDAYPGSAGPKQIAYFDQSEPETMFDLVNDVRAKMQAGAHSFFVHADGTRSRTARDTTAKVSSVFIELAIEMGVPIVPVRFTGGLPIGLIDGKAEVPVDQGTQDYWLGEPIEPGFLASLPLKERTAHVVGAINILGGTNANERPNPGDAAFAAKVADHQRRTGVSEVFAAMWEVLEDRDDASDETMLLREALASGSYTSDGTERGDWLDRMASLLLGRSTNTSGASANEVVVSATSHPQLIDHAVEGVVVVPVVYAMEWMIRAATAARPDLKLGEVTELKVLKGIVLPNFADGTATKLDVSCEVVETSDSSEVLLVRLSGDGRPHYSCRVTLAVDSLAAPAATQTTETEPHGLAPYGRSTLFHGPAFRVISGLGELSSDGVSAAAKGVLAKDWPNEPWISDPALIDGGLQVALLWTEHMAGRRSLPTSIGSVSIFAPPARGLLRIVLRAKESTETKSRCDIDFIDTDGAVVCAMVDVVTHTIGQPASTE